MNWTAEEFCLVATAGLFVAVVVTGARIPDRLSRFSMWLFGAAAAVCLMAAVLLATVDTVRFAGVMWLLPFVPIVVIAVLLRERRRASRVPSTPSPTARETPPASAMPGAMATAEDEARAPVMRQRVAADKESDQHHASDASARARAYNPHTDPSELAELAYSYPTLRPAVAGNPATPATVLDWLAESRDPVVTAAIAARGSSTATRKRP